MVYINPLGRLSKLHCSTTKRVPIPNYTSSKAPGELLPTPTFSASALFQLWRYRAWNVIHTVVYGYCSVMLSFSLLLTVGVRDHVHSKILPLFA